MKLSLLKPLAAVLLALSTATPALADQGPGPRPGRREMRAYVQQQVLPAVRQQRQKLDAQLSSADQAQLTAYRTQLHDLRQRRKALRDAAGTAPGTRPTFTEAQQQQLQQLRTETHTVLGNVAKLAAQYDAPIRRLLAELQPQQAKWTADLQALAAKNGADKPATPAEQLGRRRHGRGGVGRLLQPTAFLLLDPNAPAAPERPAGGASLYPNPTTATSQLSYDVAKAGPVTVELLDGRGNALRTVAQDAKQDKGAHTLPVDVADLPRGTYFFKITTRAGSETRRFVKE